MSTNVSPKPRKVRAVFYLNAAEDERFETLRASIRPIPTRSALARSVILAGMDAFKANEKGAKR
jgi:hypothetical protein